LARPVELFGEAALFEKALFKLFELLIQQVVGLVDQADGRVGRSLGALGQILLWP
jgi:hypothetical protein